MNKADLNAWEKHYRFLSGPKDGHFESRTVSEQRSRRQMIVREMVLKGNPPRRIAELGCGEAKDLASVGLEGIELTIGIDYSDKGCTLAQSNLRQVASAEVIRADIRNLPLADSSLSTVFSSGVIEHLEEPHIALDEIARALRKDGTVVTFVPNKSSLWSFYRHFRDAFSPHFSFVSPWPVRERSYSFGDLDKLMSQSGFVTNESFGIYVSYLLIPLELLVERLGGSMFDTRFGDRLLALLRRIENAKFIADLLGMEICHISHRG